MFLYAALLFEISARMKLMYFKKYNFATFFYAKIYSRKSISSVVHYINITGQIGCVITIEFALYDRFYIKYVTGTQVKKYQRDKLVILRIKNVLIEQSVFSTDRSFREGKCVFLVF